MLCNITSSIILNLVQFYPIPNEKTLLGSDKSEPKIEVNVVRLKMLRSPSIEIDNAAGSLGFIADHGSYLNFGDL
jgi:hypothetical protein